MKTHTDLDAWKLPMSLILHMCMLSADFVKEAIDGLTSQISGAAIYMPSNVGKGAAKGGNKEFIHFLNISLGSMAEIEAQIILSESLGFISPNRRNDTIEIQ